MARRGGWLRYLRLGCLGTVALTLVAALFVSFLALVTARPVQVEDHVLTPALPSPAAGEIPAGGRVTLVIGEAELEVEPVVADEPFRIEARYDVNAFALEEELDPGASGGGPWTYRATFRRGDRAGILAGLVSRVRGSAASLHVFLPAGVPLDLDLDMREGGAVLRLGGLWLRTAGIQVESGALDLDVQEPMQEPMESLSIRSARGGCLLNRLGNASPRRLEVSYRMGAIDMDLGGQWLEDAEIEIDGGVGGGVVHLPSGVVLEGLDLGEELPPDASEPARPILSFSVSTGMGYLEYSRIHLRDLPER